MKNVLVVGGAGNIGSHMVKRLAVAGIDVTTLDNLSSGHRNAVTHGAHLLALRRIWDGACSTAYNPGKGTGFWVQEVIDAASCVIGRAVPVAYGDRRPGEPAGLVADSTKAKTEFGWHRNYTSLQKIVGHAWQSERRHLAPWSTQ